MERRDGIMGVNWDILPLDRENLERYLSSVIPGEVRVCAVRDLAGEEELKGFGYGVSLLIECVRDITEERFVLHTISRSGFGHERRSDRASNLLLDHATFNDLPRHVRSRDVGALGERGTLISLGEAGEFFHLTDYAEEQEVADPQHRLERLGDVETRYRSLLERKEQVLPQTNREDAERLLKLSEAQADARSDLRELREAISAGRSVLKSLDSAISTLRGAESWGTVDLLGGGVLTTAVKRGRIDEARRWIHRAQQQLRRFQRELTDLEPDVHVEVEVGAFETFADYFFDGLIADWVVQARVRSSLERSVEMRRRVQATVNALRRECERVQRRTERIEKKRKNLIERA
jgi:hypothetical protein